MNFQTFKIKIVAVALPLGLWLEFAPEEVWCGAEPMCKVWFIFMHGELYFLRRTIIITFRITKGTSSLTAHP